MAIDIRTKEFGSIIPEHGDQETGKSGTHEATVGEETHPAGDLIREVVAVHCQSQQRGDRVGADNCRLLKIKKAHKKKQPK